jgi:hypothetical protein
MDRRIDPRSIVTPYAFSVHPDLLGVPLATPGQRLGAILIDLVVIGLLSQVGGVPLAAASTLLLFWLAFKKPGRDVFGKIFRIAVGCLGFLVLLVTVIAILGIRYGDDLEEFVRESEGTTQGEVSGAPESTGDQGTAGGFLDVIQAIQGAASFGDARSREEAQAIANQVAQNADDRNLRRSDIRELLAGLMPEAAEWSEDTDEIIDEAMASLISSEITQEAAETPLPGSETVVEAEPGTDIESGGAPGVLSGEALDSIATLGRKLQSLTEDRADLEDALSNTREELEAVQRGGLLGWLWNLVDELGLGFGWAALYLTIVHAWWRGTSVGKKVFRIRVVMIDLRPLNWWLSFERAGGYAAGFATGFLGFAQIFWDPNRQAIHDKVSETIVIQEGGTPVPGPWIEEGKAQWARGRSGSSEPGPG